MKTEDTMRKKLSIFAIGALFAALSGAASAQGNVGFSISIGGPGYAFTYADPAPVYYGPPPVYYGPSVYYAPPVYYGPRVFYVPPVVAFPRHHHGWHRGRW